MELDRCQILTGDCRAILPSMEAGNVQCCVTSPPYWGLRDYGTGQWESGEDVNCDHIEFIDLRLDSKDGKLIGTRGTQSATRIVHTYRAVCGKCGARRIDQQLGLESTSEQYIANMVAVFRELWRVLRDDGTLWLNLGDSYASDIKGTGGGSSKSTLKLNQTNRQSVATAIERQQHSPVRINHGLKPKDLCMIPARVAMALQADGWYLRSDIIWHKPNPMPESVTDRPTTSHEHIFLLAKQERYFYDAEAIKEKAECDRMRGPALHGDLISTNGNSGLSRRPIEESRNKRSVWTIATQPYAEAHFATFPEEIPKLCILAGSKPGDTVLDPFAGSGTVGKVALELGRRAILIELNPVYIELARDRTFVTPGFL
jgi:DNA modification methylase